MLTNAMHGMVSIITYSRETIGSWSCITLEGIALKALSSALRWRPAFLPPRLLPCASLSGRDTSARLCLPRCPTRRAHTYEACGRR